MGVGGSRPEISQSLWGVAENEWEWIKNEWKWVGMDGSGWE